MSSMSELAKVLSEFNLPTKNQLQSQSYGFLSIGGRIPCLDCIFGLWKQFNVAYSLARAREKANMWDWDDEYYIFSDYFYPYVWSDEEYEDNKEDVIDEMYGKKISERLFEELQQEVYHWISVAFGRLDYYVNKVRKASLRLSLFVLRRGKSVLAQANKNLNISFLQHCYDTITEAFGEYNVRAEIALANLMRYVSDTTQNNNLITMR